MDALPDLICTQQITIGEEGLTRLPSRLWFQNLNNLSHSNGNRSLPQILLTQRRRAV
jgi:hypothetical protein